MSTLTEIEAALGELSPEELAQVEAALHRLRRGCDGGTVEGDVAELERKSGFDVFPKRSETPITIEVVRRLCAEENI